MAFPSSLYLERYHYALVLLVFYITYNLLLIHISISQIAKMAMLKNQNYKNMYTKIYRSLNNWAKDTK